VRLRRVNRRLVAGLAVLTATLGGSALPGALAGAHAGGSSYTLSYSDGHAVRWNPCQTIRWRINLTYAPHGALSDTKEAFSRLARNTGMTFSYAGTTSRIPQKNWSDHVTTDTKPNIIVAWAKPGSGTGRSTLLPSGAAGYGGWAARTWVTTDGENHPMRILAGFALLNRNTNSLAGGYGSGETRGQLILHELGHAIGLEHTSDKHQIMYPTLLNRLRTSYGDGDKTGLDKLGRDSGCIQ